MPRHEWRDLFLLIKHVLVVLRKFHFYTTTETNNVFLSRNLNIFREKGHTYSTKA